MAIDKWATDGQPLLGKDYTAPHLVESLLYPRQRHMRVAPKLWLRVCLAAPKCKWTVLGMVSNSMPAGRPLVPSVYLQVDHKASTQRAYMELYAHAGPVRYT